MCGFLLNNRMNRRFFSRLSRSSRAMAPKAIVQIPVTPLSSPTMLNHHLIPACTLHYDNDKVCLSLTGSGAETAGTPKDVVHQ